MTSLLTDDDLHWFNEGTHARLHDKLGARIVEGGVAFAVWAPNARRVSVVGSFNDWDRAANPCTQRGVSGIWETFVPALGRGALYKFFIASRHGGYEVEKADPFGLHHETPPQTGSVVWDLEHTWGDAAWMADRARHNALDAPQSIYEVHLGSWRRPGDDPSRYLTYREIAPLLAAWCLELGFTHVELMPVMEHPFYGSWGYQVTGYFAPTSRYGTPQDLMYLIDVLHQHGIGVILDWVPAHFPTDEHGLGYFDGTHLFEHEGTMGFHPDWKSFIFNYGRNEVRSFLLSSALFWLDRYHVDGLRVDGVASMLYLDYSREPGEWTPNRHGGRENLDALDLIRQVNEAVYGTHPDVQTIAEESTSWPMVSRPTYLGGLGFGLKWDMGWMHDTLRYLGNEPVHRSYHHGELTFRSLYAFHENFCLPLSHDEVVHGKGSLLGRMPGDDWQRFANLRLLLAYMWVQAGKKLLFMGGEFGQWAEWDHDRSLDWHLLEHPAHDGVRALVAALNRLYRVERALHEQDCDPAGFEWLVGDDAANSVLVFLRHARDQEETVLCALNFTPVPRDNYRVGVDQPGTWEELLSSDAAPFGGSDHPTRPVIEVSPVPSHERRFSLTLTLPPLGMVIYRHRG